VIRAVAAVSAIALSAAPALADDRPVGPSVDAQRFRLDPVGTGLPGMPGADLLPRHGGHVGVGVVTALSPLEGSTETEGALIHRLTTMDVGLAYGFGFLDVFAVLPLHMDAQGGAEDLLDRPHLAGFAGLGDVGFGAVVRLLDVEEITFGLSIRLAGTLPTGDETSMLGWAGPTFRPSVVTEFRAWRIRFLTETAVHLRPPADALAVVAGHALELSVGLAITPTTPTELRGLELAVMIDARPELPDASGEPVTDVRRPMEWRVALVGRPTPCLAVQAGGGTGIGPGWGTPRVRIFAAVDVTLDASGRGCGDRSAL